MKESKMVDFWTGVGIMALGVFAFVLAGRMHKVPLGIGPGDYPRVISLGLCVLGAILAGKNLLTGFPKPGGNVPWKTVGRMFLMVLLTFAYIQLMKYLGFVLVTPFFLVGSIYLFGYRKWRVIIATGLGVTITVYYLFYSVFQVLLPRFSLF